MKTETLNKLEFDKIKQHILSFATSQIGIELIENLFPYTNPKIIERELKLTIEMKDILAYDDPFPIDGIKDIRIALRRCEIEGSFLMPSDFLDIKSVLAVSRLIREYLSKREDKYPNLWDLAKNIFVNRVLEYNIDEVIDESGNVKDNASPELRQIREEILKKQDYVRKRLYSILKQISEKDYTQDDIIPQRDGRLVIPVKVEHKKHVAGVVHGTSSTGLTVFIEPAEIVELNNEILQLQFQEQKEVERILRELTDKVRENLKYLHVNINILGKLDFIYAKAKFALQIDGYAPEISEEGPIVLNSARHPILLLRHGKNKVVPLDFKLGDGSSIFVISGPNSGGKTVVLKTVGLLTLMAQAGIPVPLKESSKLKIFKKIFIDIGDEQSVEKDLSSFGSHIKNLKRIISEADDKTLVLLDELGSGTDPAEGGALGIAIIEKLKSKGSSVIVTTHNSAIKFYAYNNPQIECGAMEFDHQTLAPTYRLRTGVPGSSYAFEIAKRLGLDEEIVNNAKEYLDKAQVKVEEILSRLEALEVEYRKLVNEAKEKDEKLNKMILEYKQKLAEIERERKKVKREALNEFRAIVENARARIEEAIRKIKETEASKESVKEAHKVAEQIEKQFDQISKQLEEQESQTIEIKPGDFVKMKDGTQVGEVLQVDGSNVVVEFGAVKMVLKTNEIEKVEQKEVKKLSLATDLFAQVSTKIDVRGMRADEAISAVDKFIDTSFLYGLKKIEIIHGKGTGKLKQEIAEFLKRHPNVKSFRLGSWEEGGDGVTIVELNVD
ncbi:DNA mismatch repair protein MutS2 [Candidatus Kryptonium thompsonii]|uniref:endonuclease MutS2 n=1 Tax=Candidatus Kryptonium thompsonii TaxID=1633631 RepID=UPI00063E8346|nr:endonuclease MutS2 [Candidatus Kryptonium thompsoni]CUS80627.1 DNA mismatch repair protein MutS2 [Candidatus Kryptonium thompsoni]CUS98988.1 DNA mismatch repair protein MutS2 [Candidatus Kryptonium thompsoni]